ncbi:MULTISPECIES: hypothetical protein [unclassified Kitasatospora]|uniref:hypothetical protein n=1 Tax=unclassified Kitasatospora TaxID=2633591 RepID=UPI0033D104E9
MDIVVVLEMNTPTNVRALQPDRTPADPENAVRRAHQAPAEPSGACSPLTFCGLATSDMTIAPYPPSRPGRYTCTTCSTCQSAAAGSPLVPGAVGAPFTPSPSRIP